MAWCKTTVSLVLSHRYIPKKLAQNHNCWCPGSVSCQIINRHQIDCICPVRTTINDNKWELNKVQQGMLPWWPLLEILFCCPILNQLTAIHLNISHVCATHRSYLQVPNRQMTCRNFPTWQGTIIADPAMATEQHVPLHMFVQTHNGFEQTYAMGHQPIMGIKSITRQIWGIW